MTSTHTPWWESSVIYQIYPQTFADANRDGVGDLQGIIQHLDYLNDGNPASQGSLGVNAIWLSPIFASPMGDCGYDVSNYYQISSQFGSRDDFDQLLDQAHQRGIKVILDLVLNHTSEEHAWFQASQLSKDNEKSDWYIWRDPSPDGGVPNNWRSYMGGSGWTFCESRQQYYFHTFQSFQPDLNWRCPAVVNAIADMVRYWLDQGVDGFRLDASSVYSKDEQFRDNPLKFEAKDEDNYDSYHHLYDKDLPENHDIMRLIRKIMDEYGDRVLIGETSISSKLNESVMFYGVDNDELHLPFEFEFPFSPWHPGYLQQQIEKKEVLVPNGAWPVYFLDNHDIPRHLSRWIACSLCTDEKMVAKGAAAMLLTLRGTVVLYYGQEIGMKNHESIPEEQQKDQAMKDGGKASRDGARTPMQWDDSAQAGFSGGKDIQPWLPVHPDYESINVADQQNDPDSVFQFYRQLLRLRSESKAIRFGSWTPLIYYPDNVIAYLRQFEHEQILVVINYSKECSLEADRAFTNSDWQVLLSNKREAGATLEKVDTVQGFEISILRRWEQD